MWLPIPSLPGYFASDDGLIQGPKSVRKTKVTKQGYEVFNAWNGHYSSARRVHQLVCEAFHGSRPPGHEVRHLNGDRLDNRAANLRWGTKSENMLDKIAHGHHHELNKTHCPLGHEYTPENTYRWPRQPTKRKCRECNRINCRARSSHTSKKCVP